MTKLTDIEVKDIGEFLTKYITCEHECIPKGPTMDIFYNAILYAWDHEDQGTFILNFFEYISKTYKIYYSETLMTDVLHVWNIYLKLYGCNSPFTNKKNEPIVMRRLIIKDQRVRDILPGDKISKFKLFPLLFYQTDGSVTIEKFSKKILQIKSSGHSTKTASKRKNPTGKSTNNKKSKVVIEIIPCEYIPDRILWLTEWHDNIEIQPTTDVVQYEEKPFDPDIRDPNPTRPSFFKWFENGGKW